METRNYNCKAEELPMIANHVLSHLKRDAADFAAFSPKLNASYIAVFAAKIEEVSEVLSPRRETAELKIVTERLYKRMDELIDPIARVEGYARIAQREFPLNIKDFGLSQLRYEIRTRDAEGVLAGLKKLNEHLNAYRQALTEQGLSDALAEVFPKAATAILDDELLQCEIVSNRKRIVENNLYLFNDLYSRISEICTIGKIIRKGNRGAKKDYTFTELKKRAREKRLQIKNEEVKIKNVSANTNGSGLRINKTLQNKKAMPEVGIEI